MSRRDDHERAARPPAAAEVPDETATAAPFVPRWRLGAVTLVLCGLFGAVMARAHHLQVRRADDLGREAEAQVDGAIEIQARRGAIYDRHGRELAVSVRAESVYAHPRQVVAPREAAAALSRLLGQPELELYERLSSDRSFVWLSRRISPQVAEEVRALELPGVSSMPEWQRFYPMRQVAGHLLGFTGDDGHGLEGIERTLESVLSGGAMEVRGLRDALGNAVLTSEGPELEAMEGASIALTLDSRIQRIAERELERAVTEEHARTGIIVVVEPESGAIVAMACWPPFDPNRFRTTEPRDWRNRAVTDSWEPGSTMKVFTFATALEAGLVTPTDEIDTAGGRLRVGNHTISDHTRRYLMTASEVIQISSNIGAYRLGARVGDRGLYESFERFGFGSSTGSGLGGEQAGVLARPPWVEVELANRAFGQGLTATPLQMALAYSALANGGLLMAPLLVSEIRNKNGDVMERPQPRVVRRVISERTAQRVMEVMEGVTEAPGTGTRARIPGIRVAGKTGTAQKVNPETGQYDDLWMASFVGIVPAEAPELTIVVMIDEPQVGHYGGEVAAPVFARVAEQALATRGIFAETSGAEPPEAGVPELTATDSAGALGASPAPLALDVSVLPVGHDGRRARVTLPDLTGLSLAELLAEVEPLGLDVNPDGWGLVARQWPTPGASVLQGSAIEVFLASPYELGRNGVGVSED